MKMAENGFYFSERKNQITKNEQKMHELKKILFSLAFKAFIDFRVIIYLATEYIALNCCIYPI